MIDRAKSFEDSQVFQRAYKASLKVHRLSLEWPQIEQGVLGDQLRRSTKSICANFAEGFAKKSSQAEFRRYVQICIGSAEVTRVWLRYAHDLDYLDAVVWQDLSDEYQQITKMLMAFARSLASG